MEYMLILGVYMVNVTIYGIHGSYGLYRIDLKGKLKPENHGKPPMIFMGKSTDSSRFSLTNHPIRYQWIGFKGNFTGKSMDSGEDVP